MHIRVAADEPMRDYYVSAPNAAATPSTSGFASTACTRPAGSAG